MKNYARRQSPLRRRKNPRPKETNMGWLLVAAGLVYAFTRQPASMVPPQPEYVGLSSQMLDYVAAAQEQEMWCWAASIQTILNSYGIPV